MRRRAICCSARSPSSPAGPPRRARARASSSRPRSTASRRSTAQSTRSSTSTPSGRSPTADAVAPGDARPFAGVPIAIKNNRAGRRACALTFGVDAVRRLRAGYDHNVVRRLRDGAASIIVGTTKLPEFGILPVDRARRFGPDAQPVGPRPHAGRLVGRLGRRGRGGHGAGRPRATTAAARSASRPRAAGSSGSSPRAAGSRWRRTLGDSLARQSTACSRARSPRPRGCSTCSPATSPATRPGRRRRPSRSPTRRSASPAGCASALATDPPCSTRRCDPECAARRRATPPTLLDVARPRGRGGRRRRVADAERSADRSRPCSCADRLSIGSRRLIAGREPTARRHRAADWAIYRERAATVTALDFLGAHAASCRRFARSFVELVLRGRRAPHARRWPSAPLPIGTLDTTTRTPCATFARAGTFTPFTADREHHRPAGDLAAAVRTARTGCRSAIQLIGRPAGEAVLLALAAQLEAARPWAERRAPSLSAVSS